MRNSGAFPSLARADQDRREGGRTLLIVASCDWREDAGVDTSGDRILPAFKGGAAYDCLVITQPGLAKEGFYLLIDPAANAESLTL